MRSRSCEARNHLRTASDQMIGDHDSGRAGGRWVVIINSPIKRWSGCVPTIQRRLTLAQTAACALTSYIRDLEKPV